MSAIVEGSWSNVLTVSQKGKHCGEIRKHFRGLPEREITDDLRERAESELRADPQCQGSYYDLLLVDQAGNELDFETNILTLKPTLGVLRGPAAEMLSPGWDSMEEKR